MADEPHKPAISRDAWYESEEPMRLGMVAELQRIRRRTVVRPIPVVLLAIVVTAAVTYKFANKPKQYEARVVLAMAEGALSQRKTNYVMFDQLKEYVQEALLPNTPPDRNKDASSGPCDEIELGVRDRTEMLSLQDVIERHNLFPLRKTQGMTFALNELRDQFEIEIWKNSFVYFDDEEANARKSARIGITVTDRDPDMAFTIARDLASIAIKQHERHQQQLTCELAQNVVSARDRLGERLEGISRAKAEKLEAATEARRAGKLGLAGAIELEIVELASQEKRLTAEFSAYNTSQAQDADDISAAGLDLSLSVVEERKPEKSEQSDMVLVMIITVIGTGALIGSAMFVGAFDSRVHDAEDVARLRLPVLGHVPGFAGDDVGSLQARGVPRRRVPSFLRWR